MTLAVMLALMGAPVLYCCLAFVGSAHADVTESEASGPGGSMHDHCANGETGSPPPPDQEKACGGCASCDFAGTASHTLSGKAALLAKLNFAPVLTAAPSRPDFMPALLRSIAPPQGPPAGHATPVVLNTLLRL